MWPKIKGGTLTAIGFILSPLSWWNDLFINLPIAYGFAYLVSHYNKSLFFGAVVAGYWLTNILGLVLMHHGLKIFFNKKSISDNKVEIYKTLLFSIIYTIVIVLLIKLGWIKTPSGF